MPVDPALEARLAELEAKVALNEDLLEQLNRTIYRQQQHLDRLQQQLRELDEAIDQSGPTERLRPADEIPPHY